MPWTKSSSYDRSWSAISSVSAFAERCSEYMCADSEYLCLNTLPQMWHDASCKYEPPCLIRMCLTRLDLFEIIFWHTGHGLLLILLSFLVNSANNSKKASQFSSFWWKQTKIKKKCSKQTRGGRGVRCMLKWVFEIGIRVKKSNFQRRKYIKWHGL
jgi:hypothetical protein